MTETKTTFTRYVRTALATYVEPSTDCDALEGRERAIQGEVDLREAIESGSQVSVVLIAPERGSVLHFAGDGSMSESFAWIDDDERQHTHDQLIRQHTSLASIRLEIESDDFEGDPVSAEFAEAGSCLVHTGRIVKIHAAHWLGPVADQVARMCGAPIELFGDGRRRPFIPSLEPVTIPNALPTEAVDALIRHFDTAKKSKRGPDSPEFAAAPTEEPWSSAFFRLANALGTHYELPVDNLFVFILRYSPGASQGWHVDNSPLAPESMNRTVSFSVHLSRPGEDYEGADLETEFGSITEAGRGDLVGFTAKTPHRVTALASGERYALVCFGSHE